MTRDHFLKLGRANESTLAAWWWTIDRWILFALALLISIGILLVMASSPFATSPHQTAFYLVKRHCIVVIPSICLMVMLSFLRLEHLRMVALGLTGLMLLFLMILPWLGVEAKGARRWIFIAGFSFQPSEPLKPGLTLVWAWIFSYQHWLKPFHSTIASGCLLALTLLLLIQQPDLGMSIVFVLTWVAQLILIGTPFKWLALVGGCGVCSLGIVYLTLPHVSRRIDQFLGLVPEDKFGGDYQILQSLEALVQGGLWGKGPGEGRIKQFLPDAHKDFIFAVAGEEFGLVLCLFILILYAFIIFRFIRVLFDETDFFTLLAIGGLVIQFGTQAMINIASAMYLIPPKGMTLPFISYGGSSFLSASITMGFLLALTRKRLKESKFMAK